ncbi:hypothetical protein H8L32_12060 [Undibacterium sp. CY18W]|uniref:Uncharacterized protein n=1 Tax=Undibacterium hunanense TaxID=2762292 RepID=A0ABR6ZQS4_9BURK|nr:hypothetical protein [Undibacterium hunanense]MBC3918215.1 hypothetical protein [Undibacterium hunanense]
MTSLEISIEKAFHDAWPTTYIKEISVVGYIHVLRHSPRSSPKRIESSLTLAKLDLGNGLEFMLAPKYRLKRKKLWEDPIIECGDRLNPPPDFLQLYRTSPTSSELLEFINRINFFYVSKGDEVIECFGPVLIGLDIPKVGLV